MKRNLPNIKLKKWVYYRTPKRLSTHLHVIRVIFFIFHDDTRILYLTSCEFAVIRAVIESPFDWFAFGNIDHYLSTT